MKKRDPRKNKKPSGIPVKETESLKPEGHDDPAGLFPVVGIGASAGGLEAFTRLIHALPPQTGMALVYIQHLDPTHPSMLAELLARETTMPVQEAKEGLRVQPDHVYVIVPNTNLTISRGTLHLSSRGSQSGMFMPVDEFFNSLAGDQETFAIGVILSGTASDGSMGIRAINKAGGITFAQSIESASQDGMPRSAIDTGAVDFVLDPQGIAEELVRIGKNPALIPERKSEADGRHLCEDKVLENIFLALRNQGGVDFSHYRQNTVGRRITRRMILHKFNSLDEYSGYLNDHPEEIASLAEDMLIHVTSFFREPRIFEILKAEIFPPFFKDRPAGLPIRIWIPGCSTGEEVYSIQMSLLESMEEQGVAFPVQIFGSDISEPALTKARDGIYSGLEVITLSEKRRTQFFDKLNGDYQVKKMLRESCIFAYHDLTRDPPFSHLDFISCRNLLIYLDVPMQRLVIPIFHYSLNPEGILLLGISETVGPFTDLFATVNQKFRIYRKKPAPGRLLLPIPFGRKGDTRVVPRRELQDITLPGFDPAAEANRILGTFGPPSVFVNESMEILQFSGGIGPYLEPVQGAAGLSLNKMIHRDLLVDISTAIRAAKKTGKPVRKSSIRIKVGRQLRSIGFTIVPVHSSHRPDVWHYLLVIEDDSLNPEYRGTATSEPGPAEEDEREIAGPEEYRKIQQELADAKAHIREMIEEERGASEDLLSALHELQSQNEELQSINEELETAKEELQSSNEELATVNEELQTQLVEREKAEEAARKSEEKYRTLVEHNPDMMLRYDRQYHLVYANPAIKDIANVPPDKAIGKTPEELNFPQNMAKGWQEKISEVFTTGKPVSLGIETWSGNSRRFFDWFLIPEFDAGGKVESVLSTSRDITGLKTAQEELGRKNEELNVANINLSSGAELQKNLADLTQKGHELSESLAEKEVLLSEVHHRVKNNLAAFISLLSLGGMNDDNPPEWRHLMIDLQNRARSMALVHETLYRTKTFSSVDMEIYLTTLIEQVVTSYKLSKLIKTVVDAKGVSLDLDRATPCGLIITELATNALKYAFPPSFDCRARRNEPCTLTVSLTKRGDVNLLTVTDNGVGFPEGFDPRTATSLGLKLVNFLAHHQLRATIEYRRYYGTEVTLRFRDKEEHHEEPVVDHLR
jgi:two-component system CheB/CheR fusion protein